MQGQKSLPVNWVSTRSPLEELDLPQLCGKFGHISVVPTFRSHIKDLRQKVWCYCCVVEFLLLFTIRYSSLRSIYPPMRSD